MISHLKLLGVSIATSIWSLKLSLFLLECHALIMHDLDIVCPTKHDGCDLFKALWVCGVLQNVVWFFEGTGNSTKKLEFEEISIYYSYRFKGFHFYFVVTFLFLFTTLPWCWDTIQTGVMQNIPENSGMSYHKKQIRKEKKY